MDKKHILIVEDDASLASLLSERLVSAGFEVEIAGDGEKALKSIEKKPNLVMLDLMLPKVDGLTVMKAIRDKSDWGITVPIVVISNLSPGDDQVISSVAAYEPVFYFVKAENSLDDILEKTKGLLLSR